MTSAVIAIAAVAGLLALLLVGARRPAVATGLVATGGVIGEQGCRRLPDGRAADCPLLLPPPSDR
jgi:hypothetical protein